MRYQTIKAIIIKRTNYKDYDKIVTAISPEKGKFTFIAKGVRKVSSRKKSSIETFAELKLALTGYKDIYYLSESQIIEDYSNIKNNISATLKCIYMFEIIDKLSIENEPDNSYYHLTNKTLKFINNKYAPILVCAFNLKLLKMLGFYSINSTKVDKSLHSLFKKLEVSTLNDIIKHKIDEKLISECEFALTNYTESIIESKIKSLSVYQHLKEPLLY